MDEAKLKEIQQWLVKSKHDIDSANLLLNCEKPILDTAVYHCQQAVEKGLKAYLTYRDTIFEKTHDLVSLASACTRLESSFSQWREVAQELTPYATDFRYPGDVLMPEKEEAEKAFTDAESFLDFILKMLPDTISP